MAMTLRHKDGFTLIELAIVLVIIGLVVGSVFVGRDLIETAAVRKTVSQVGSFRTAANVFRTKYGAIPGDFPRALQVFTAPAGAVDPGWPGYDCRVAAVSQPPSSGLSGPCNGNDDGRIDWTNGENMQTWYQLKEAGLIEGRYSGLWDDSGGGSWNAMTPGFNIPKTPLGGGYMTGWMGPYTWVGGGWYFTMPSANVIEIVSSYPLPGWGGPLTPLQAYNIDTKMDDGHASTGQVMTRTVFNAPNCVNGSTATSDYNVSDQAARCPLFFINVY